MRRAQAVCTSVTATYYHHVLVLGSDRLIGPELMPFQPPILLRQVVHGEVDADELTPLDRQVARDRRSARQHDSVVIAQQLVVRDVDPYIRADDELDALRAHLLDPAVNYALLQFELWYSQREQSTNVFVPFIDGHVVPCPVELLRASQAGRTRSNDCHAMPISLRRWFGIDPSVAPSHFGYLLLDHLDRHGFHVYRERASRFARRGTNAACELREVVGGMQTVDSLSPITEIRQVVPLRNQVPKRATVIAEWDTAIHASRSLITSVLFVPFKVDLSPIVDPMPVVAPRRSLTRDEFESVVFRHVVVT